MKKNLTRNLVDIGLVLNIEVLKNFFSIGIANEQERHL